MPNIHCNTCRVNFTSWEDYLNHLSIHEQPTKPKETEETKLTGKEHLGRMFTDCRKMPKQP